MSALNRLKSTFWWLPFGRVAEISANQLQDYLSEDKPIQIIDVRSSAEWRRSHVPGAVSVPIHVFKQRLERLQLDARQPIVAICLSAHRSRPAVRLLRAKGFSDAVQLAGGMLAWWNKQFPTEGARQ